MSKRTHAPRPALVLISICVGLSALGCGPMASLMAARVAAAPAAPRPRAARRQASKPAQVTSLASLTPTVSGPAVFVFDPESPPELNHLAAGIGLWLDVYVCGQPEFGQTPVRKSIWRCVEEKKLNHFRTGSDAALTIGRRVGLTHVVTGRLSGTSENCTVTYRIQTVADGRAVGEPVELSGSADRLTAALPRLATEIAKRVGARSPVIPTSADLSGEELTLLGKLAAPEGIQMSAREGVALVGLRDRNPMAGLFSLGYNLVPSGEGDTLVARIVSGAQSNARLFGWLAMVQPRRLSSHRAALDAAVKRFPRSFQLNAAALESVGAVNPEQARSLAATGVRLAPRNPDAFLALEGLVFDGTSEIRKGRFISDIEPADLQRISIDYRFAVELAARAASLDPGYGRAWYELSTSAAFAGHGEMATRALWKAMELIPDETYVYSWGLQLFQPKWLDDREQLERVARAASTRTFSDRNAALAIQRTLWGSGFCEEAREVARRILAATPAKTPTTREDMDSLWARYQALSLLGDLPGSISTLEACIKASPESAAARTALGQTFSRAARYKEAVAELTEAIRLNSKDDNARYYLAWAQLWNGQLAEAREAFEWVLARRPNWSGAHEGLGELHLREGRLDDAVRSLRAAVKEDIYSESAFLGLARALLRQGKRKEALEQAEQALQWASQAARTVPDDLEPVRIRAGAYSILGKDKEAQADWERVIKEGSPHQVAETKAAMGRAPR